jgi:MFS family permease
VGELDARADAELGEHLRQVVFDGAAAEEQLVAGAALSGAFIAAQLRARQPLVELRLFAGRNFGADAFVLFCCQFALLALSVFGAIYIQNVIGFSAIGAGLALLPLTLPLLVTAPAAGRLYDRLGPRGLVAAGCVLIAATYLYSALIAGHADYWRLLPGLMAIGIGIGLTMSPASTDAMNAAAPAVRGQASGAIQTVRQVGGTIGLPIAGAVVTSLFISSLESGLARTGASTAKIALAARVLSEDPATQARAAAATRPDDLAQITRIVRHAITDGISASYAAAVMLIAGVVAWLRLRKVAYTDDEPTAPSRDRCTVDPPRVVRTGAMRRRRRLANRSRPPRARRSPGRRNRDDREAGSPRARHAAEPDAVLPEQCRTRIVGLTVVNACHVLNRDGRLIVTVPETVEASADELAPPLQAA